MQNSPLVTVLMPCYNAQDYLPEALESIMQQSYQNLDILCINDGSTDNTVEILQSYAAKDSRIRIVHNETNLKLIKTLNKGIDLARGEYIARMDADDLSMPERIKKELLFLQKHNLDFVSCQASFIDKDGHVRDGNAIVNPHYPYSRFYTYFINPFVHSGILIKTSVLLKHKYPDVTAAHHTEDYMLWSYLLREEYKAAALDENLIAYRLHQASVSSGNALLQYHNFSRQLQKHIHEDLEIEMPLDYAKLLAFDPSISWHSVSPKQMDNYFSAMIHAFLSYYPYADKTALLNITNRHKRRIHLFALRMHPLTLFTFISAFSVLLGLRRHYEARRRF